MNSVYFRQERLRYEKKTNKKKTKKHKNHKKMLTVCLSRLEILLIAGKH
jgi:hypothetical protein